jgi:alpha-glucosidase
VGYAYWSHDIGGHQPGAVAPELYTRWVQFGAFSPILRTHTSKNPEAERRVWAYPEPYSSIMRSAFQLRYSLGPYLYTEARRTYDTGVAFFRPLYYDWPEEEAAYVSKGEYMFGDEMLAAPVTAPADPATGLAKQGVWLPPGEWIEWPTGKRLAGPAVVERSFSIEQTPVYLRPGAIVPMQPPMRYTGEKPVDPLILNVWPLASGTNSGYSVYEDSGVSVEYQKGIFARTPVKAEQTGDTLKVEIGPVEGGYPGMAKTRAYEVRLPADWPPASVTVDGVPVERAGVAGKGGWSFEGNALLTVIPVASVSVGAKVTVEVRRAEGLAARRAELDGFAGMMTRLRAVNDALRRTSPAGEPPEALIDALQAGDRLSYHPELAVEELARFRRILAQVPAAVRGVAKGFAQREKESVKDAEGWVKDEGLGREFSDGVKVQHQHRLEALAQALKLAGELEK